MRTVASGTGVLCAGVGLLLAACGAQRASGVTGPGTSGGGGATGTGGAGGGGTLKDPYACSDLFDQATLQQYWIDISASEMAKMDVEFHDIADVLAGKPPENYHPIVFHFGSESGETVTDAAIRLKGQSSWVMAVQFDPNPKMQFVISFDQNNPNGKFHGSSKLGFDMPPSDWTLMHERLANTWWRRSGVMAPCSNSGQLFINGAYYGLYVIEEHVGHGLVKTFFPTNPDGNLFKGGHEPDQNGVPSNVAKQQMFWAARDIASMTGLIDLAPSVKMWAGDALLNNGDGYYGGAHNFYLYDQGAGGYIWLPADTDSTFDWLAFNSPFTANTHPIFWWMGRPGVDPPGQHYMAVMNDKTWRKNYVDDIAAQVDAWDVARIQSEIDTWSQQIAQAVQDDPHKEATMSQWKSAVATARKVVADRPAYLKEFVACERGQGGADADGDGVKWCDDCDDTRSAVHPGAPEICGNGIDDNCNGAIDEGCPAQPDAGAGAGAAPDGGAPGGAPDGGGAG